MLGFKVLTTEQLNQIGVVTLKEGGQTSYYFRGCACPIYPNDPELGGFFGIDDVIHAAYKAGIMKGKKI
jgi:hypothetical protein